MPPRKVTWPDLSQADQTQRRDHLAHIAGPLGLALQPRWLPSEPHPSGEIPLRFAMAECTPGDPILSELEAWAVVRPQPFWPKDEHTLQARDPERLWTLDEGLLEQPTDLGRLLAATYQAATRPPQRPRLMGIVNVTPDSFSDGGQFHDSQAAVAHGESLIEEGADLLDVGGESTRPGSHPVPWEEEWRRIGPVIKALAQRTHVPISVDTSKAEVARRALEAGATWVNDVRAGTADQEMLSTVAAGNAHFVAMHCVAPSKEMQRRVAFGDPVRDVAAWLRERVAACLSAGIPAENLWLDPGIGFGKHLDHNLSLLRRLWEFHSLGCPLLLGVSRKSFIEHLDRADGLQPGSLANAHPSVARIGGTAAAVAACVQAGTAVLRVHDIATMGQAARVAFALQFPQEHRLEAPPQAP